MKYLKCIHWLCQSDLQFSASLTQTYSILMKFPNNFHLSVVIALCGIQMYSFFCAAAAAPTHEKTDIGIGKWRRVKSTTIPSLQKILAIKCPMNQRRVELLLMSPRGIKRLFTLCLIYGSEISPGSKSGSTMSHLLSSLEKEFPYMPIDSYVLIGSRADIDRQVIKEILDDYDDDSRIKFDNTITLFEMKESTHTSFRDISHLLFLQSKKEFQDSINQASQSENFLGFAEEKVGLGKGIQVMNFRTGKIFHINEDYYPQSISELLYYPSMHKWISTRSKSPQSMKLGRRKRENMASTRKVDVFLPGRKVGFLCSLCLVVDEKFVKTHRLHDSPTLYSRMSSLIEYVSWVFRSTDWNDDGVPENIGFQILRVAQQAWDPFPSETEKEYNTPKPAFDLLVKLAAIDFSQCCLGVGFTMRQFELKQGGVSFIASKTLLGGICDSRRPTGSGRVKMNSANVVLISGTGLKGIPFKFPDLTRILAHELGHTFGAANHDADLNTQKCLGYEKGFEVADPNLRGNVDMEPPEGHYIMSGRIEQGRRHLKPNNLLFSPCSKQDVLNILRTSRTMCFFTDSASYCGNGIVEDSEECDCGNELQCREIACCGSRISPTPCKLTNNGTHKKCQIDYLYGSTKKDIISSLSSNFDMRLELIILNILLFNYIQKN